MKRSILIIAIATAIFGCVVITGCYSSSKREETSKERVLEVQNELKEIASSREQKVRQAAISAEWVILKRECEHKIAENQIKIADLRRKLMKRGHALDAIYVEKIDKMEERNFELKLKISGYQISESNWEPFKSEFNHDMNELGVASKDLVVNNKE